MTGTRHESVVILPSGVLMIPMKAVNIIHISGNHDNKDIQDQAAGIALQILLLLLDTEDVVLLSSLGSSVSQPQSL